MISHYDMELKLVWHRTKIGIQAEFSKSWKKQAMNKIEYCPYWMQVELEMNLLKSEYVNAQAMKCQVIVSNMPSGKLIWH